MRIFRCCVTCDASGPPRVLSEALPLPYTRTDYLRTSRTSLGVSCMCTRLCLWTRQTREAGSGGHVFSSGVFEVEGDATFRSGKASRNVSRPLIEAVVLRESGP